METQNPFSIIFGVEPKNTIERLEEKEKIIGDFSMPNPPTNVYLITGLRRSGKTVLLSSIADYFKKEEDWIVVDASSKKDILETLASSIYEKGKVKRFFLKKNFSFSFQGASISIRGENPVSSVQVLLEKMLDELKKQGKKVLITIDEADNSEEMKVFIRTFQSLIREKYALALLMTGLYENISKLQGDKSLTFFVRAPKIFLKPLPLGAIADRYIHYLGVSNEQAVSMAKLTSGYAYAYQVLGYLFFSKHYSSLCPEFLSEYDQYLAEYVYEMVYAAVSPKEQTILKAFQKDGPMEVKDLIRATGIGEKAFSVYRARLLKEGILFSPSFGRLQMSLPRFSVFLETK